MESFQFTKFPGDQSSYNLEVEGLHQSEESHIETESTPGFSENVELPLPPGTSGDEFFISLGYKPEAFETSNTGQQISNEVKSKSDSFEASNLPYGPQLPSTYTNISEKPNKNESGFAVDSGSKSSECLGDIRYSPSKVDSDEENQDVASKPKLLGKEQAKKRLMAFSVAKQSAAAAKKQNKTTPAKSKEKPPNPNKGTNFQEQFRATISAIEEEKKKIYQNMPDYLLQEMKKLVKGQIVSSPNLKSSNKKNKDSKRKSSRHDSTSNKSNDHRRSSRRSRSRSRSRGRGRVRRSRSRSRSNGAHSKNKKRSWSKSRRSRSPGKKPREEKPIKTEQTKSGKIEKDCISKKEVCEDWKSYKLSGAAMESDPALLKNECLESETQEQELDNTSPGVRAHFKPIFNYLKKGYHKMTPLRAKVADSNNGKPALFPEKTIKFTRTKPIIIWTENPTLATDYYMPKEVLLENCPSGSDQILRFIIEGKNSELNGDEVKSSPIKSRPWYPRGKHLPAISPCSSEKTESLPQKSFQEDQSKEVDAQTAKRKISLVNEDYLSDEAEQEEITVGGVKVQLDLEMNTVKVRSKWDSDFEDGNNEKETSFHKTGSKEIPRGEKRKKSKEKLADDFDVERLHGSPEKEPQLLTESPVRKDSNSHPGYLASEYEEFLKMVSFDSKDTQDSQTEKLTQYEIEKIRKMEKPVLENDKNLKLSMDWDRESEQEEELKIPFEKPKTGEKLLKPEKLKKKRNQIEKAKPKKKKIIKKTSKVKKYKYKDSYSDDSSSSESESDSESNSTESRSSKEKKRKKSDSRRKKILKGKKKSKKYSSDKSESDSDNGKTKKKKKTKKKDESSDSDESEDKLLKQIDLKKQLIMKKVEQIDTVMEKIDKKKGKENESKKECSEKDKGLKPGKKKNKNIKKNKLKKLKKTETESDSMSSRESTKRRKTKKEIKKKRYSSESSDSEEETKYSKTKSSKYKKAKKEKKKKGKKYSTSSESEESSASKKLKKKKIESSNLSKDLKSSIPVIQTDLKMEERLAERGRKFLKKKEKKTKKEDDDWETSSSSLEAEEECESSWDEGGKTVIKLSEIDTIKEKGVDAVVPEKGGSEKNVPCNGNLNSGSENLKNSLSNFSFNENSFCGFGQELSRDFFLTERSFSSSANIGTCANAGLTPIDARPFQCIGKGGENRVVESELYSPGCSDSEVSETEAKSQKSKTESPTKDVYDPLNCDSEGSGDNNEVELSRIPLPTVADISRPEEAKQPQNVAMSPVLKVNNELEKTLPSNTSPMKFLANEFNLISNPPPNENSPKKQIMNFKGQQTLKTKAASVFQDDSDEENKEPEKTKEEEKHKKTDKETEDKRRSRKETRDGSKERDRKRSSSREIVQKSPCKTPEASKREIRSDSFEIEPLKSVTDDIVESVQPIPVLLGVSSSNRVWSGSLPGYEFPQVSDSLVDQAESFDIYPSEESKYPSEDYIRDDMSVEKATEKSVKRRKSRSRSLSPKKKRKSKSPVRRRSPKRWSVSPKHRDKSPRSPRRRSPKRKSPSRRRSRSPSRRRKSRRLSSPRRSRSKSPSKRRSPKRWDSPPRRKDSPSRGYSPRRDAHYPTYTDLPYWVPPVGTSEKDEDMEVSPPGASSPQYDNSMAFPRMPAPSIGEAEMNNSFYEGEYVNEYGVNTYREEIGMNNLITVKNHIVEKIESPRRPSLDQRIELELGSPISSSSSQFPSTSQPPQTFEGADPIHYQTYNCDNSGASENFYQNQTIPDFNGQYFNEVQPANYGSYPYPHPPPQPQPPPPSVQNAVMQVGNIVEVVPALQHPLRPPLPPPKAPQIMQVGNVLQVVPTQKVATPAPVPPPILDHESLPSSPVVKTQKATAVVAPSSVVPPPNLEAMINPLIKAILLEREKRRKGKEKRRLEREARRKARQLRREAKLMSVSEKLKKSVQNEGLVLGQEVEDDELLDAMDIPSPPVPVQIITVSSPSAASPAGKGILITAGFVSKSPSKKKEVKFADGVYPGEGTSSSGEEDIPLSPPKPKLPKEKPFKKKKIKVKKKVKVHIIKQILHEEEEDDEDDDNLSPPPPPPGDPPPVFFARFPFAGNAQFPVYQTQTTTTTTTTTTFQYPAQAI